MMDDAIPNPSSSPDTDKTLLRLRRKCEMTDVLNFLLVFPAELLLPSRDALRPSKRLRFI